jgi:type II secretory pathway component PulC
MMKTPKTILVISILFIAFILMEIISSISSSAQDQTTDMSRKNGPSQSRKTTQIRNPFLLPPGIYFLSKEGAAPVRKEKVPKPEAKIEKIETPSFKVRAILISDQIRLATIGSHIVAVGDKLDDETILAIQNDRVILGKGDGKRTLHLHQSPVQLTIEEKK